jgi:hypothetical protein
MNDGKRLDRLGPVESQLGGDLISHFTIGIGA